MLDHVSEDCHMLVEFGNWFSTIYSKVDDQTKITHSNRTLLRLSDEGLVRLHWGPQCTFPYRAPDVLAIAGADIAALPADAWSMPASEPYACVCDTALTWDAYNAAARERNGGPSA